MSGDKGVTPARVLGSRAADRVRDAGEPEKGQEKDPGLEEQAAGVGDAVTALTEALGEDNG